MLIVFDKKMVGILSPSPSPTQNWVRFPFLPGDFAPVRKLEGHLVGRWIIDQVFHVATPFQDQRFQASLG
jgi:hypothetical protein